MQDTITSLVVKLKKLPFEKQSPKSPIIIEKSGVNLKNLISSEKDELLKELTDDDENINFVLISALLERAKELKVMALMSKNKSKKDIQYNYLSNVATLHESIAESIV
jgi:hypothetical protein